MGYKGTYADLHKEYQAAVSSKTIAAGDIRTIETKLGSFRV